jgi:hypothetical protein
MPLEVHEFSARLIELFIRVLVVELGLKVKTIGGNGCAGPEGRVFDYR